jgi:uncharacterized membrane protein YphA (DoxX/SURF4 family)
VLLAFGILTRVSALLAAILLAASLLGATGSKFRVELGAASPFSPELVMVALALVLVATGGGNFGFDRRVTGGKSKASAKDDE